MTVFSSKWHRVLLAFGADSLSASIVFAYLSLAAVPEGFVPTQATIDVGNLEQGQTVHAEFELVNHFRQSLQITNIFESCACSTAGMERRRLAPGERAKLAATWKTGGARGPSKVDLQVQYALEDARQGMLRLSHVRADFCFNEAAKKEYCVVGPFYACSNWTSEAACTPKSSPDPYDNFFACAAAKGSNKNCNPTGNLENCVVTYPCVWDYMKQICKEDLFAGKTGTKGTYKTDDCN